MEPIFELGLTISARGSRDLVRTLHAQLRAAILDGRLAAGTRLPATRAFARKFDISRNSAIAIYDLLISEGYVDAQQGSGSYVADMAVSRPRQSPQHSLERRLAPALLRTQDPSDADAPARYDFRLGRPETRLFPFDIWRRLSNRALRQLGQRSATYLDAHGRPQLREAIARHVAFTRAVSCDADDIIVTSGAQQAFHLIARALVSPGETMVAVEDPGYPPLRDALALAGARLAHVPVDDQGMVVDAIPAQTQLVCVTPSHQFPLGVPMSPGRRRQLLDLAAARGIVIVEDDYDAEFRFGGVPLDALQTLDRSGLVFYVGTFSKSLFPALRLGFVVAPAWARDALIRARELNDGHSGALAQDTLAHFIEEGHLARHVRRMRRIYADRRRALLDILTGHPDTPFRPFASSAGLHVAAALAPTVDAAALCTLARTAGIAIRSLDAFASGNHARNGLALGYGLIDAAAITQGAGKLIGLTTELRARL